ncbi:ADP-ribosylation [Morchella conica CCBAS932]|uniref:NAD(+) ADP-ribosyltransferase n=1 Tax=Morchella conica CCBAS932 TaxID=1392247 RepID=A0A3N4KKE2_9PEZI|nr:ADP-ribosylation [Morchella conica CCBAS932]
MASTKIFDGFCIAMVGSLHLGLHANVLARNKNLVASAKKSGTIKIVHIRWLLDSISRAKALNEETYQFGEIKGIQNALIRGLICEDRGWTKLSPTSVYSDSKSGLRYDERLSKIDEASEDSSNTTTSHITHEYTIAGKRSKTTLCTLIDVYNSEIGKSSLKDAPNLKLMFLESPENILYLGAKSLFTISAGRKHAVHKDTQEYKLIHKYFKGSGGPVIIPNCNLQIFRILRENEEEHWNTKGWANIQSILKNGLQDPNGLGGVYFANRAGVSYCYCRIHVEGPPFVMFLCEVQLGYMGSSSPFHGKLGHYNTAVDERTSLDWSNAKSIHKELDGVLVPQFTGSPMLTQHSEWIAHNPSQVRLRFLVVSEP